MRRLIIAAALALSLAFAGQASAAVPSDLAATLAVTGHTSTTATVVVTQTSGATTTLHAVNTCYAGATFAGTEDYAFVGTATLTYQTGPRKKHGATLTPDHCYAQVYYQINGNLQIVLADNTDTLP